MRTLRTYVHYIFSLYKCKQDWWLDKDPSIHVNPSSHLPMGAHIRRWLTSTRQPCLQERKSATVPASERITVRAGGKGSRQDDATLLPSPLKGGNGNHSSFRCSLACHLTTDRMTTPHDPRANEVAEDMLGEGWTGYSIYEVYMRKDEPAMGRQCGKRRRRTAATHRRQPAKKNDFEKGFD